MPTRLLLGLLPEALLQTYVFWQDEEDHLRGYASAESCNGAASWSNGGRRP